MIHKELLEINKHEANNPREDSMKDSEQTFHRRHAEMPRDELVVRRIQMKTGKCFSSGRLVALSKAGGDGSPLQDSRPENLDGEAWWAAVGRVAWGWTRLQRLGGGRRSVVEART